MRWISIFTAVPVGALVIWSYDNYAKRKLLEVQVSNLERRCDKIDDTVLGHQTKTDSLVAQLFQIQNQILQKVSRLEGFLEAKQKETL